MIPQRSQLWNEISVRPPLVSRFRRVFGKSQLSVPERKVGTQSRFGIWLKDDGRSLPLACGDFSISEPDKVITDIPTNILVNLN